LAARRRGAVRLPHAQAPGNRCGVRELHRESHYRSTRGRRSTLQCAAEDHADESRGSCLPPLHALAARFS
jgi:hypothetical protein